MNLTKKPNRYNRQLPVIGADGQQRLQQARVLCIGSGGLGCPALLYLNAAGIGTLGIVDGDRIELSNLQRQMIYHEADVGKLKVEVARERCLAQNSLTDIICYPFHLDMNNTEELISGYDIIIDATDNYDTRYLINHSCRNFKKPLVSASVLKFDAQIGIFNYNNGPCYQCLYPQAPTTIPNCSEAGVVGVVPGIAGTLQASETIKLILGLGDSLAGKLLTINLLTLSFKTFNLARNISCQQNCEYATTQFCKPIATISTTQLAELLTHSSVQLIDVREPEEHAEFNIGGTNIPLAILSQQLSTLDKQQQTVVYCRSGRRSAKAYQVLIEQGFVNVQNLEGGVDAIIYSQEITYPIPSLQN